MGQPPPQVQKPTTERLATMPTPAEIARLVGLGVSKAIGQERPQNKVRINTSCLKMKNPDTFNGKTTSVFNQWWESVTMYLGFYPKMVDRQKIACIGMLLSDTALSWYLHRYRERRDNDTGPNYSAAIRAEFQNESEAAVTQLQLGQLKYQGSIRTYMTEF